VHVTREITEDAKLLLRLMGLPIIEAPSEAEAQCAALVKAGKANAVASEDMDSLTFGASYLLRGFNSKKEPITEICLEEVLNKLEMTQEEFIDTCILLGCDYTDHINGVGPGTGYKLIKQHANLDNVIQHLRNKETSKKYKLPEDFDYAGARELFRNAEVIPPQDIQLSWSPPNEEELTNFLVTQKSFNPARVESGIKKMKSTIGKPAQTRLESFFGKPIKRVSSGGDKPAKKMKTPSRGKSGKK
jgi:flap endonuclease-1